MEWADFAIKINIYNLLNEKFFLIFRPTPLRIPEFLHFPFFLILQIIQNVENYDLI